MKHLANVPQISSLRMTFHSSLYTSIMVRLQYRNTHAYPDNSHFLYGHLQAWTERIIKLALSLLNCGEMESA